MASDTEQRDELRDRPLGEITRELMHDVSTLVRQEVDLAKAEMAQKGRTAVPGLQLLGAAGVAGLAAVGATTAFLILLLAIFLPEWASALIVGAALAATAYVLAKSGKEKVEDVGKPIPEQAIESVKEDAEWAGTQAKSARR